MSARNYNHTIPGATETIEGVIPHLQVVWDGGLLLAPVKVYPPARGEKLPRVRTRAGKLLYALPGGGECCA